MTNCYLRKDGRWEARIALGTDANGKRRYRSVYGKTQEEAAYKRILAMQSQEDEGIITEMTVRELCAEWLHHAQLRLKESTAANYRMKLDKHILPAFGDNLCHLLKRNQIYDFIERKLAEGLSARYVSDIVVLLKSIFRYGSREYQLRNTVDSVALPKSRRNEPALLSPAQQSVLRSHIAANLNRTTLGVALSLNTGIRIGELCALQWRDIDLSKRILYVRNTIQRIQCADGEHRTKLIITAPKSRSSVRAIPIPEQLCKMLHRFAGAPEAFVLSGTAKPIEPRTMQYRFAKLLREIGLPSVRFHSLRHAFASGCIALGFDVKTLSEILGHSSIELTLNQYVHSSMERKRACMALLDQAA